MILTSSRLGPSTIPDDLPAIKHRWGYSIGLYVFVSFKLTISLFLLIVFDCATWLFARAIHLIAPADMKVIAFNLSPFFTLAQISEFFEFDFACFDPFDVNMH